MGTTYQTSSRNFATQSLTLGSTAASSTAVFGSQTYQVRLSSNQMTKYVIGDAALATSTSVLNAGANLPPNVVEYVTVNPGQVLSAITTSTTALFTVTETSG